MSSPLSRDIRSCRGIIEKADEGELNIEGIANGGGGAVVELGSLASAFGGSRIRELGIRHDTADPTVAALLTHAGISGEYASVRLDLINNRSTTQPAV